MLDAPSYNFNRFTADSTAAYAVCPSPQIDPSFIASPISSSSASSVATPPRVFPSTIRCSASSCRTVPTRHGTHCPHDSSRKKAAMRRMMSWRSTRSSKTTATPEPSVVPAARVSSCVSLSASSSARTKPPAAPPRRIARNGRPPATPPAMSSSAPSVVPKGISYTPGLVTQPLRQKSRVPVLCAVPVAANAAPPSITIGSTFTSVSTLLTTVGLPNNPCVTGNGGLLRGSPRFPSIDSKIAVSSPQIYAPAPRRISMSKATACPIIVAPR